MSDAPTVSLSCSPPPAAAAPAPARHQSRFQEFLSELNPLQYIPVVGTIYRAVTGDTIPDMARTVGSFVVSGLTGGPVGLATNAAFLGLEKVTGIDPEKIGQRVLAQVGIGHAPAPVMSAARPTRMACATGAPLPAALPASHGAWSTAQLTAYGVTVAANGTLRHGKLEGADVLNDMELAQQTARMVV